MFKKIRVAILSLRIKCLAWRIKRRDRKAKFYEFRTKSLIRKFFFLSSIRRDIKK